ncbi:MAG: hypothetical protein ACREV0_06190 [Burkholderiales bacterium]
MEIYRQGNVLLIKVRRLPMGAKEEKCNSDRVDVCDGKALPAKCARVWSSGTERFIQVVKQTTLTDEKHAPVMLDSGVYRVVPRGQHAPKEIKNLFAGRQKSRVNSAARNFAVYGYKKAA